MGSYYHRRQAHREAIMLFLFSFLLFSTFQNLARCETIQTISTHTKSCLSCGMIEEASWITLKVCGSSDCCLSRSLDNDNINWIPGQTDSFSGQVSLEECAFYEIGNPPFTVTAFHDGSDGLTLTWIVVTTNMRSARCNFDQKLDGHQWLK